MTVPLMNWERYGKKQLILRFCVTVSLKELRVMVDEVI